MTSWDSQSFVAEMRAAGRNQAVIDAALAHANAIRAVSVKLPVLFTLAHLAQACGVSHKYLLAIVGRDSDPYRDFLLRKRSSPGETAPSRRYRTISVPEPELLKAQRWIQKNITDVPQPHRASVAYSCGDTLLKAAERHSGARWLIKVDIERFFESIREPYVAGAFSRLGYPSLLCFELARLCTRLPKPQSLRSVFVRRWQPEHGILRSDWVGFLPQGAPTSPQLSNLVMRRFDRRVSDAAAKAGLRYTRYSDDLIFSTSSGYTRERAVQFVHQVYDYLGSHGFEANRTKTVVSGPGARKVVLGLLVDRERPRLTREFRRALDLHLHYLERDDVGPIAHATHRGFDSVIGLQNHVFGLIAFARQVDKTYGLKLLARARSINWPI